MMKLAVFCVIFVMLVVTCPLGAQRTMAEGYYPPEDYCSRQGGICVHYDLCGSALKDVNGCPNQMADGAVCCLQMPPNENRCENLGGECLPYSMCPQSIRRFTPDCESGTVCCYLM